LQVATKISKEYVNVINVHQILATNNECFLFEFFVGELT